MLTTQAKHKTFTTVDENNIETTWSFFKPKESGANGAGELGGFYQSGDKKCLIKQDSRIPLNIAEFLAGRIYQKTVPEISAKIRLVRADDNIQISSDGRNIYLVSEFIPGWQHDLYAEIQLSLKRNPDRSKYKLIETMQLIDQLIIRTDEMAEFFKIANNGGNLLNFGQATATSLLVNNTDTHVGNLGVILNADSSKKLAIVDYGAAFRNMTPKINPHSFKKYLSTHTLNREGWNNFLFYPESIKITPEFVYELDRASTIDLAETVKEAFSEIKTFYGIRPIVEFAVRAGISLQLSEAALKKLEDKPSLANKKINQIQKAIINQLAQRQCDLSRFSAQIKMDMCIHVNKRTQQCGLDGSFVDTRGHAVNFNDVVLDHFAYFKEIILGNERFKFRQSTHKHQPQLIDDVKRKAWVVFASFVLVEENKHIQDAFNIRTMQDAINALQHGTLDKRTLDAAFNKEYLTKAQIILSNHEQSIKEDRFNTVMQVITNEGITPSANELEKLKQNKKLQEAIIALDNGCNEFCWANNHSKRNALAEYKKGTIQLVLHGKEQFKKNYDAVEKKAILAIDDSAFTKFARIIGNIIFTSLATASIIGLFAMALTGKSRGGMLLFHGPEREFSHIAAKLGFVS